MWSGFTTSLGPGRFYPLPDQGLFCDSALHDFNGQLRGCATLYPNYIYIFFFPTNRAFFWWYLITCAIFTFCAINKKRATILIKNKTILFTFCYIPFQKKNWKSNVFSILGQFVFCYIFLVKKKIPISVFWLVCAKVIASTI